jgi:murein DD-endopeptidase MepM/ murein hydrolase activator NlpD
MSNRLAVFSGAAIAGGCLILLGVPLLMVTAMAGARADLKDSCGGPSDSIVLTPSVRTGHLSQTQLDHAAAVLTEGYRRSVPKRAMLVALAVAHQESGFLNYANDGQGNDLEPDQRGIEKSLQLPHDAVGSDHGSLGVFQQQWPWWGTMPELMDPSTAAGKFYTALLEVPGWDQMEVTEAGQAVQDSAHPNAYADDEPLAQALLDNARLANDVTQVTGYYGDGCGGTGTFAGTVVMPLAPGAEYVDLDNYGETGPHWETTHTGTDFSTACGTPVVAATDGVVDVLTDEPWAGPWLVQVAHDEATTSYAHMQAVDVSPGDRVSAGQQLGQVGALGNATGCHLHFEVHTPEHPEGVDPTSWLQDNVGKTLDGPPPTPSPGDPLPATTATLLTANVPFTLSTPEAAAQVEALLNEGPDVLLLQEVTGRDVSAIVSGVSGTWGVWQPEGSKGGSAVVWNTGKFRASAQGAELGFDGAAYDRWMPWVLLESDQGTLPVVALHMPTDASKDHTMAGHYQTMTANYQKLATELSEAGYPPVMGGDWNHPLDVPREPWSPVPMLEQVGFTTNWRQGLPCPGTSEHNGRIDGFAFNPAYLTVTDQGCLDRGPSDHRPVWIAVAPAE